MNVAKEIFNNLHISTDLIDSFGKRYQINENDHTYCWLMINEVDPYLVFFSICQLAKNSAAVRNRRGFDITVDNIENAFLVEDMKKWVLHRRVNERQSYNPNDKISTYRIYRFGTIK